MKRVFQGSNHLGQKLLPAKLRIENLPLVLAMLRSLVTLKRNSFGGRMGTSLIRVSLRKYGKKEVGDMTRVNSSEKREWKNR